MLSLGNFLLTLALCFALYSLALAFFRLHMMRKKEENASTPEPHKTLNHIILSPKVAFLLSTASLMLAFLYFVYIFSIDDVRYACVFKNSNSNLPLLYKITAIWSNSAGSIFLWTTFLALHISLYIWKNSTLENHELEEELCQFYFIISATTLCYFIFITIFTENPFASYLNETIEISKRSGLNPILQNFWMVLHPIFFYAGITGLIVPFTYALAKIRTIKGDLPANYHTDSVCYAWILASWILISVGILSGMAWSYIELGWGGIWSWDPVESAALIPWLLCTACIHFVALRKSSNLSVYSLSMPFLSAIFSIFVSRSNLVLSMHAFSLSRGWPFITFIICALCYIEFIPKIFKSTLPSCISVQHITLYCLCYVLLALAISIALGVALPVFSKLINWQLFVGHQFFNLLSSITSTIILFMLIFFWISKIKNIYTFCGDRASCLSKIGRILVHLGVAILILSITYLSKEKREYSFAIKQGESAKIAAYVIRLNRLLEINKTNYQSLQAEIAVADGESSLKSTSSRLLFPEHRYYQDMNQITTEVDILTTLAQDLYIAFLGIEKLTEKERSQKSINEVLCIFKVFINPGQIWIWIGGLCSIIGGLICFSATAYCTIARSNN